MALQRDAFESRLKGLRQQDRRPRADSASRTHRRDGQSNNVPHARVPSAPRMDAGESSNDLVVTLLRDIARRIDGLERADRALNKEVRRRAHRDGFWRLLITVSGIIAGAVFAGRWLVNLF